MYWIHGKGKATNFAAKVTLNKAQAFFDKAGMCFAYLFTDSCSSINTDNSKFKCL